MQVCAAHLASASVPGHAQRSRQKPLVRQIDAYGAEPGVRPCTEGKPLDRAVLCSVPCLSALLQLQLVGCATQLLQMIVEVVV